MWSYCFGYYRPLRRPEINKQLFEHRQSELERHCELLSKWVEKFEHITPRTFTTNDRITVINLTKLSLSSLHALLDVAVNAFEPDQILQKLPSFNNNGLLSCSSQIETTRFEC
jgi:hypothetical protein